MSLAAFDTNVLAYAVGLRRVDVDDAKIALAERLVDAHLHAGSMLLPVQVCLELHRILLVKKRLAASVAATIVQTYVNGSVVVPTNDLVVSSAFGIVVRYGLQTYDAAILAAAASAGCEVLYSEDMQHGFVWSGTMIVNPFA